MMLQPASQAQFYHFQIFHLPFLQAEPHHRADLVEPLPPAGPGVDVQEMENGIGHDLEDVGVAANEQPGMRCVKDLFNPGGVFAGVASDMGEKYFYALQRKNEVLRITAAQGPAVDIAENSPQGLERLQLVSHFYRADVARVPDLVAPGEVVQNSGMQVAVGVGEQADALHF